jgi:hypothetical protein
MNVSLETTTYKQNRCCKMELVEVLQRVKDPIQWEICEQLSVGEVNRNNMFMDSEGLMNSEDNNKESSAQLEPINP